MSVTVRRPAVAESAARPVRYLILRLTGVLLAVLVVGHLVVTHVVTDVADTDANFIAQRWSSALWLAWDGLLLACALAHAAAGVWSAIDDYGGARRRGWRWTLLAATAALFGLGLYTIARAVYG